MDKKRGKHFSSKIFKVCNHRRETHRVPEILLGEVLIEGENVTIPSIEIGFIGGIEVWDSYLKGPSLRETSKGYLSKNGVLFIYNQVEDFENVDFHYFISIPEKEQKITLARAVSNFFSDNDEYSRSVHDKAREIAYKKMRSFGFRDPQEHVFRLKLERNKDSSRKNGKHLQTWRVYFNYNGKEYSTFVELRCVYHHNRGGKTYVCRWVEM